MSIIDTSYFSDKGGDNYPRESIADGINEVNRACWHSFFNTNDQIRSRTTSKVYKDFVSQYSKSAMDFTQDNINFVVGAIIASAGDIHKQNMEELFDKFVYYADDNTRESRKTNYGYKIGMKVIVPSMCDIGYSNDLPLTFGKVNTITDIEKVLCTLDATDCSKIHSAGDLYNYGSIYPNQWYEFDLFKVKFYKKGTMHLMFNNKELIDKFNLEICKTKNWIPSNFR